MFGVVQVLEEGMGRRGEAVQPLMLVLHRTLADVQERLTFRAQAFIKVRLTLSLQHSCFSVYSLYAWTFLSCRRSF